MLHLFPYMYVEEGPRCELQLAALALTLSHPWTLPRIDSTRVVGSRLEAHASRTGDRLGAGQTVHRLRRGERLQGYLTQCHCNKIRQEVRITTCPTLVSDTRHEAISCSVNRTGLDIGAGSKRKDVQTERI